MTWTRIDDQMHAHPKVLAAWHGHRAALGLHLLALSHSGAYLTDGHVSEAYVKTLLASAAERRRVVGALTDAVLWEPAGNGWLIHDYHDYNRSRADVLERHPSRARGQAPAGAGARAGAGAGGPSPYPFKSSTLLTD